MKYVAIIDADEKPVSCEFFGCNGNVRPYLLGATTDIKALEQEPKTGHWIDDKCSVCGKGTEDLIDSREWYQNEDPKYCPFCGVKLIDS